MSGLRLIFAGTPDFSAHHLQALLDAKHQIVGVYTQPDRPAGRGKKLVASPVKQLAEAHDLPVFQPHNFKAEDDLQQLRDLEADVMIVVAYGLLLPEAVLSAPTHGCINVHASLLPRWRGAAPIQRAIAAGDTQTGVTIMQMDIGLDTGDMLIKVDCDITPTDTGGELHDRLLTLGGPALLDALKQIEAGELTPEKQDHNLANYAHKLTKQEAAIDWTRPASELELMIRAFNPFPVAHFSEGKDRIRVWDAVVVSQETDTEAGTIIQAGNDGLLIACGSNALLVKQVQLPGKKVLTIKDILNGHRERFAAGKQLPV